MLDNNIKVFGNKPRSIEEDQKAGKPIKSNLSDDERSILEVIMNLFKNNEINLGDPESIFNDEYEKLPEQKQEEYSQKGAVITNLLRQIKMHYESGNVDTENMTMKTLIENIMLEKQNLKGLLKF